MLHSSPTFAPSSQRTALSVRGFCYTACRPLLLRRKGRLSVLMICFRWVRSNPLLLRRKVWLNPAYVEHQQQQACNTIRGYWFLHHGPSARNPRLVVGNGLRPFCVDSEFGLVFYSYLSIGTLNLYSLSGALPGLLLQLADLCSFVAKDGSQCSGALLHQPADLCPSSQRTALSVDDLFPLG